MPTTLVTGADRGLGLEFVKRYLADGWALNALIERKKPSRQIS